MRSCLDVLDAAFLAAAAEREPAVAKRWDQLIGGRAERGTLAIGEGEAGDERGLGGEHVRAYRRQREQRGAGTAPAEELATRDHRFASLRSSWNRMSR